MIMDTYGYEWLGGLSEVMSGYLWLQMVIGGHPWL